MATQITAKQIGTTGASTGDVLTFNGTNYAPAAPSGGGSSSGISGAVQFSGGSGTFSSDATNFFFNDTTNQLQLNGGTTYGLLIAGNTTGAIDASAASSVTGAFTALRSNTSATGSVGITLNNTNNASGTAHSKVTLSTLIGGGDPFFGLATSEVGYVIGIDNTSDKLLIGVGTDPSTMTTTNITLTGELMGVMQTSPTAKLHLGAGSATANTAPLKLTSGTAMTTPEDGAVEYHGSHLYFTIGSTRYQLDQQAASTLAFSGLTNAASANTLDNTNYLQTWNWSTLSTTVGLTMSSSSMTTGNLLNVATSNASFNSTNGVLQVSNNGTSINGTVLKVVSNGNIAGAGFIVKANGNSGFGLTSPTALAHLGGTPEINNGGTSGMFLRVDPSGLTDKSTAASGTVTHTAVSAFNVPTVYATNASVTYTNASTLYLAGAPTAGTNVTITNAYTLWTEGNLKFNLGSDATGDILYRDSTGKLARLGIGAGGTALTVSGGIPAWTTNTVGDVTGPGSSVDGEIVLYNSTTGRVIKRATGTGVVVATSGVYSTKTNPSGAFVGDTDTQTLTSKRINPRVSSNASSSTPTPNADTDDVYLLTALAANATFGSPTGTPVQGQRLLIRVKDNGTARTLAYNAIYRAIGVTLPTTTVVNKTLYLGCFYNATDTKWDIVAVQNEA